MNEMISWVSQRIKKSSPVWKVVDVNKILRLFHLKQEDEME